MSKLNQDISTENKEKTEINYYSKVLRQNVNFSVENASNKDLGKLDDYLKNISKQSKK